MGPSSPARGRRTETLRETTQAPLPKFAITAKTLKALGAGWKTVDPFAGDEDELYKWVSEPSLWWRFLIPDVDDRARRRFIQLHDTMLQARRAARPPPARASLAAPPAARPAPPPAAPSRPPPPPLPRRRRRPLTPTRAPRQASDAHGFILWRDFPALTNRDELKIHIPVPSSRFDDTWETRDYVGCAKDDDDEWVAGCPAWVKSAHELVRTCEFSSLGAACTVVDEPWAEDRFSREDATTYALCKCAPPAAAAAAPAPAAARGKGGGGGGGRGGGRGGRGGGGSSGGGSSDGEQVMAAAVITPFAAERILRSLTNADRETEVLYFDVICAVQTGAAYRLFCDVVAARRRLYPERRLLVVLLSVVSSDVLSRCAAAPAHSPLPAPPAPPPAPRLAPTPKPDADASPIQVRAVGLHLRRHRHRRRPRRQRDRAPPRRALPLRGVDLARPRPQPPSASRQPSTASAAAGRGSPPPAKAAARKRSG